MRHSSQRHPTQQAAKMFNHSTDELNQPLIPCNRLSMPPACPEELPAGRKSQKAAEGPARPHRKMVPSSPERTASSHTNSLPRAITQTTTGRPGTTGSSTCAAHASQMHSNMSRVRAGLGKLTGRTRKAALATRLLPAAVSLNYLIAALAISACFAVGHLSALESSGPADTGPLQASAKSAQEAGKAPLERSVEPAARPAESATATQKSIVASLSSAVATAAAAAAVAAAQNGLSTSDARSLTNAHRTHAQAHRPAAAGLNLAIKLVDTIPEVPYNILHNMKKVDHAAPFYNVPSKFAGGATKESTQNFLANALTASGAAEQLSVLFKSPLWKRIADGYGDFASEFRSLFRAPGAAPMKGPASPTSKLLRDISVPALLMLLASSISGEWRPVRTRRKSFRPVDLAAASSALQPKSVQLGSLASSLLGDQSSAPESAEPPAGQYFQHYEQNQKPQQNRPAAGAPASSYPPQQSGEWQRRSPELGLGQQVSQIGQQMRIKDDISLRSLELPAAANWMAPDAVSAMGGNLQALIAAGGHDQSQAIDLQPSVAALFGPRSAVARRSSVTSGHATLISDESAPAEVEGAQFASNQAPFASPVSRTLLPASAPGSRSPIGELFNANVGASEAGHSYNLGLLPDYNGRLSPIKRSDQLGDEHRYSLVGPDEISGEASTPWTKPQQKPLLTAVSHAVASTMGSRLAGQTARSGFATGGESLHPTPALLTRRSLVQDLTAGSQRTISRDQAAEQRDLTKLMPESWREVVKRTMTTVQNQANTQWKSIEGQLANWVQDKLKTVAAAASSGAAQVNAAAGSAGAPAAAAPNAAPAQLGNVLASVGSTAMNILGLNKTNSNSGPSQTQSAQTAIQAKSQPAAGDKGQSAADQRGKLELTRPAAQQSPGMRGGALVGVVKNLIANSISQLSRNSPSSPMQTPSPHQNDPDPLHATPEQPRKSAPLGEIAASGAMSSVASKYPTLTAPDLSSAPARPQPPVPSSQSPGGPALAATPSTTLESQPR